MLHEWVVGMWWNNLLISEWQKFHMKSDLIAQTKMQNINLILIRFKTTYEGSCENSHLVCFFPLQNN